MDIPFKSLINFDKSSDLPVYRQIANSFIQNIQTGRIPTSSRLIGTRQLADLLGVHRKTIIAAFEELSSQGWIEMIPRKGTFVIKNLPEIKPVSFQEMERYMGCNLKNAGFYFEKSKIVIPEVITQKLAFNDGLPDVRLAPREELAKLYNFYFKNGEPSVFQYAHVQGNSHFREVFARILNETRSLSVSKENILSTRGSQMAIYLVGKALIKPNDEIIVGELSYRAATLTLTALGANINTIPVDGDGLVVEAIEEICLRKTIRAIYVTSHHYHPTTVTLKPERRLKLLAFAERFRFAIIEDDYDYDFHYTNNPILPLASADKSGLVIYIGSFTKWLAPTFRIGYVVASEDFIQELSKWRRIIDRQSDTIMELCLADMIENGTLKRHAIRSLKVYHERRDFACEQLKSELGERIEFRKPDGGMAIWANFDKKYPLSELAPNCRKYGLYLHDGETFRSENGNLNACRMGFASMNIQEMGEAIRILRKTMDNMSI